MSNIFDWQDVLKRISKYSIYDNKVNGYEISYKEYEDEFGFIRGKTIFHYKDRNIFVFVLGKPKDCDRELLKQECGLKAIHQFFINYFEDIIKKEHDNNVRQD